MIGAPLRDEQIERTLERHHCDEGTQLLGIEYDWQNDRIEVRVVTAEGQVRRLLVPPDVREMPAPEPTRGRRH